VILDKIIVNIYDDTLNFSPGGARSSMSICWNVRFCACDKPRCSSFKIAVTDWERQLDAEVACYQYWSHSLNRALGKRNSAVTTYNAEGPDIFVCTCRK
jgi:hypothetical protein